MFKPKLCNYIALVDLNRGCFRPISNMDFQFLAKTVEGKNQIMNYEQLLSSVFSCFYGGKNWNLKKKIL